MNEFFEYCTEWEPCSSLYFGDNVLQVKLLFAGGLERNEGIIDCTKIKWPAP